MAKAKKQKQSAEPTAAASPAGKEAKAAKAAPKPAAPAVPVIDTNLAASTAARVVARKDDVAEATPPSSGESAAFKQLKENLHRPAGAAVPSFLQNATPGKKFNNSVPGRNKQIGHNQTFGADVNRTGVPRRTGG